jgi:putative membrane protein
MTYLLINWLLSAVSLLIVAHLIRGIEVKDFGVALIAALVIGLVNGTLGFVLKILTFPLEILTLGLFYIVVNGLMLKLAAAIVPGFRVQGCLTAILASVLLALVNMALRFVVSYV